MISPNSSTARSELQDAQQKNSRGVISNAGLAKIVERVNQHGSQIAELRRLGFQIETRISEIEVMRREWLRLLTHLASRVCGVPKPATAEAPERN